MIYLGLNNSEKDARITEYCAAHGIEKVVILSPAKFRFDCSFERHEQIEWADIIEYKFYYRLLQEINQRTLVVVNECLRTQNRYDLTYNCIRQFLNQTKHQIIFQYLPQIDTFSDFATLFDFDTRSRWKRERFGKELLSHCQIIMKPVPLRFIRHDVATDDRLKAAYQKEKVKLIDGIGLKDPHTIPRNLYLMSGKARMQHVNPDRAYIGRNNRFKLSSLQTYKENVYASGPYCVFEFCHNFIDFADFLTLSRQVELPVLVADLKVDEWYWQRYNEWKGRIEDAYASLI